MSQRPTSFARERRKQATVSEGLLWSVLRARQLSKLKFRREHPIGDWIVDFACEEKMLIVEIDGGYHDHVQHHDMEREPSLRALGWDVIRFTDKDVEHDAEAVAEAIANHLGIEFFVTHRSSDGSGTKNKPRIRSSTSSHKASPPRSLVPRLRPSRGRVNEFFKSVCPSSASLTSLD